MQFFTQAAKKVFSRKKYFLLFLALSVTTIGIYVWYQVAATPGNDLFFQLAITPWWGFLLMALFAISTGLLITMKAFLFRNTRRLHAKETGGTMVGTASGFIASIFSSATCASCVSALFGFLGIGTVLFLLDYRWHIMAAGTAIIAVSLFFVSKRINGECAGCKI